jgi:O-antigen/teichoic acid export membrane protein
LAPKELKKILALVSGTSGAQIITFALSPLLTRLYLPEAFGEVGVFLALAAVLIPIAALTLPMAIVLAENKDEAKQVTLLSLVFALFNALLFTVLITLNLDIIGHWLNIDDGKHYLYWVPLAVVFSAVLQISDNWVIRAQLFNLKAKVAVLHSGIINGLKVSIGLLTPSGLALIVIAIINPLLSALMIMASFRGKLVSAVKTTALATVNWRALLFKYRQLPLYQSPQALLNALSQGGPVVILAALFGPVSAGYYAFSRSILAVPIMLIGKAVGDVFYGRFAQEVNEKNYRQVKKLFIQSTSLLMLIGLFPLGVILLWGPELFLFVFGDGWQKAGVYAQWLSVWTFFILINAPSLKLIIVLKQQKVALAINFLTTPMRVAALYIGGHYYQSEWLALLAFVVVSIAHNIAIILVAYRSCGKIKQTVEN